MRRVLQVTAALLVLMIAAAAVMIVTYDGTPTSNSAQTHFDTLIVLGSPANWDGTPSPEERARVGEAVAEWRAGRASHMILTGGAVHNRTVEAHAMAVIAAEDGIPANAIEIEGKARNTIENVWYSSQIMKAHGWTSAEVVSDAAHIHRAALILEHYRFQWRTQAAPWPPNYRPQEVHARELYELMAVNVVRWLGFPKTPYLPNR